MRAERETGRDLPESFAQALCCVYGRLSGLGNVWVVSGSAARWLRGFDVAPRDLDVDTGAEHIDRVLPALAEYEVGPLSTPQPDRFPSQMAVYEVGDVRVELFVDCQIRAGDVHYIGRFSRYCHRVERLLFRGRHVPVMPLEESLLANLVMGRWERLAEVASSSSFRGSFDPDYFRERAAETSLPAATVQRFSRLISR
jgi:hypothetical protein